MQRYFASKSAISAKKKKEKLKARTLRLKKNYFQHEFNSFLFYLYVRLLSSNMQRYSRK